MNGSWGAEFTGKMLLSMMRRNLLQRILMEPGLPRPTMPH
jgi:hypothetical protein